MLGCFWVGCVICFVYIKRFLVMKSNQKVGALPFLYVKTHVASECLGKFVVFSYLAFSPRISKSTHLYSTMLGVSCATRSLSVGDVVFCAGHVFFIWHERGASFLKKLTLVASNLEHHAHLPSCTKEWSSSNLRGMAVLYLGL